MVTTPEDAAFFEALGYKWYPESNSWAISEDYEVFVDVSFQTDGWVAQRTTDDSDGLTDFRGPKFDSPITAYVNAELAGWESE